MKCAIQDCEQEEYAAGFCSKHYNRLRTTGTIKDGPRGRASAEERFWRNTDKRGPDECWNYKCLRPNGYGSIGIGGRGGYRMLAHRFSYQLHNGDLKAWTGADGAVMHLCDNPSCVNPAHLRLATSQENNQDAVNKGRANRRPPRGSKHGNAIINESMAKYVKESPKSNVELAEELGTHRSNIWYIRNKGWKHV
jgi:hypothetical protein